MTHITIYTVNNWREVDDLVAQLTNGAKVGHGVGNSYENEEYTTFYLGYGEQGKELWYHNDRKDQRLICQIRIK